MGLWMQLRLSSVAQTCLQGDDALLISKMEVHRENDVWCNVADAVGPCQSVRPGREQA